MGAVSNKNVVKRAFLLEIKLFVMHHHCLCVATLSGCVGEGKVTDILLLLSLITMLALIVLLIYEGQCGG